MAFTFVQKAWNSTAGSSPATTTVSLPSVGAGHLVVVAVIYLGTATGFTVSISDGNGHSFTLTPHSPWAWAGSGGARFVWLGYILSAAAGTMTITATPSIAHGLTVKAMEFSYTGGTCTFDRDANAAPATGTTPINTPSITPTNANSLLYAAALCDPGSASGGHITGVGGSWTLGSVGAIASDNSSTCDEYMLSATGATAVNFTSTNNTGWNCSAMSFFLGGTTFTSSLTGGLSFTGAEKGSARKGLAGIVSFAGTAAKSTLRALGGALSFSGSPTKSTARSQSGSVSFAGLDQITTKKGVAGVVSFAGTAAKRTLRALAGALSFSGSPTKRTVRSQSGSVSFAGLDQITTTKGLAGVVSFAGTAAKSTLRALAGALSFSGSPTKRTARSQSGSVSFAGLDQITTKKGLAGIVSFAGTAAKSTLRTLGGTLSFTASLGTLLIGSARDFILALGARIYDLVGGIVFGCFQDTDQSLVASSAAVVTAIALGGCQAKTIPAILALGAEVGSLAA